MDRITAIYSRVSTRKQDNRSQDVDLKAWAEAHEAKGEIIRWYRDKHTGTSFERPGWEKLWADVLAGKIKRIAIWRLDRLGRTAGPLITLLDELDRLGVRLVSLRDGFDPSTPTGRLTRNVLASVAQFETEVRRERQMAGIAAAKAAGKKIGGGKAGRRVKVTVEKEAAVKQLYAAREPIKSIAQAVGLTRQTVYRVLGLWTPRPRNAPQGQAPGAHEPATEAPLF